MSPSSKNAHFPALLRFWRGVRGLSQLDLASAAGISTKHLSFLETGRAHPKRDMVLRLCGPLDLPLREQNSLLLGAGYQPQFREAPPGALAPEVQRALSCMMSHHEPFPLMVLDRCYNIVDANTAATRFVQRLLGCQEIPEKNALRLVFSPELLRPHLEDWETVAATLLLRLQREQLSLRNDDRLRNLIAELCAYPGVSRDWQVPDWSEESPPVLPFRVRLDGASYGFLTTLTVFQSPQDVTLEELRIESYFPIDQATEALCRDLGKSR